MNLTLPCHHRWLVLTRTGPKSSFSWNPTATCRSEREALELSLSLVARGTPAFSMTYSDWFRKGSPLTWGIDFPSETVDAAGRARAVAMLNSLRESQLPTEADVML